MSLPSPALARPQRRRHGVGLLLLLSCGGCVSGPLSAPEQAAGPVFDPAAFFTGQTEGHAILKIVLHRPTRVVVEGEGRVEADGTIVLDQSVRSASGPPKQRRWRLRPAGAGRWSGTLSDAAGPVSGQVSGNCLHLTFAMHGGLKAQQWLYLQPGGATVRNIMAVDKFGMPVARLEETITRLP